MDEVLQVAVEYATSDAVHTGGGPEVDVRLDLTGLRNVSDRADAYWDVVAEVDLRRAVQDPDHLFGAPVYGRTVSSP